MNTYESQPMTKGRPPSAAGPIAALVALGIAGCASMATEPMRLANGDLQPKANIPPLSTGECFAIQNNCKVTVKPTVGSHPNYPGSACYISADGVTPGALIVNRTLFEPGNFAIEWAIDTSGLSAGQQFAFARAAPGHSGGITFFEPVGYGNPVEVTDGSLIEPQVRGIRIPVQAGSKRKAFHYDVRLIYKANALAPWVPCVVLDPVVVNRG